MMNLIKLENLPNELFIDLCTYQDARMLYHSFYHLNSRFNILLQSLTQLHLILWPIHNDIYDDLFVSRVHTLVVHYDVSFTLSRYINVRRLVLFNSKHEQISVIMNEGLNLETISLISPRCFYTTFIFHEMIFSNQFPHLQSCYLTMVYSPSSEVRQLSWSQSPSLRSLRISSHDSLIHVAILNACPNLSSLHLSLYQLDPTPLDIQPHRNLKRLKFIWNNHSWPADGTIFETFFFTIPYLEQLTIQRSIVLPEMMNNLLQFDCLAKIFTRQLQCLKQFLFCLHFFNSEKIERAELAKEISEIKKHFVNSFPNRKSSYLHIKIE